MNSTGQVQLPAHGDGPERSTAQEPRTSVLFDVWLLGHLTASMLDAALAGSGLNADDFGLYSMLRGWGPMTPGRLSALTGMRQNTVSTALQRLERRGHLHRQANPADARSTLVSLNHAGIDAHSRAAPMFLAAAGPIERELAADEHRVRAAAAELDSALRAATGAAPRPYPAPPQPESDGESVALVTSPRLSDAQLAEVQRYARWVVHRDDPATPAP